MLAILCRQPFPNLVLDCVRIARKALFPDLHQDKRGVNRSCTAASRSAATIGATTTRPAATGNGNGRCRCSCCNNSSNCGLLPSQLKSLSSQVKSKRIQPNCQKSVLRRAGQVRSGLNWTGLDSTGDQDIVFFSGCRAPMMTLI